MVFLLSAIPGLREHLLRQSDRRRLLEMPEYLLDDIGVTRHQVIEKAKPRPTLSTAVFMLS